MTDVTGTAGHDDTLSPEQAAVLLGRSSRTVRRLIAAGRLAGTARPCTTTRAAVDAYRLAQQGVSGEVLPARDNKSDTRDTADQYGVALASALMTELRAMREEMMRLSRENGRLEAALEQGRQGQGQPGQENGHRSGALARLGPWLRR